MGVRFMSAFSVMAGWIAEILFIANIAISEANI